MNTIKSLYAVFLLLLFISCNEEEDQTISQLLANTDIEQGSVAPAGWITNQLDGSGLEFIWNEQEASSGSRSLQIQKISDETEVWGYWAQIFQGDIPHGKNIELSAMIKGNDIQGTGISISVRADREGLASSEGQFVTTQGNIPINGTFDWKNERIVLNDLKTDVSRILVFLIYLPETTGEIYFDDVTLSVVE